MIKDYCQSFAPFVDKDSRVLVLGSMPGPEALRRQQYYGFPGNHFWTIIPALFGVPKPEAYADKLALVRCRGIGLWDVLASCTRPGALDSAIRDPQPNAIPELLEKNPQIRAIFINGGTAFSYFERYFKGRISKPYFRLPSSSPAHAAMSLNTKIEKWSVILSYLKTKQTSQLY